MSICCPTQQILIRRMSICCPTPTDTHPPDEYLLPRLCGHSSVGWASTPSPPVYTHHPDVCIPHPE
eukprot:15296915-Alexandrium_andersonii.AAC.1